MPCRALIYAEVSLKNKVILSQKRIEKFDSIVIKPPAEGARYYVKILAINREDISKTSGVEF
ncbi:hypothetical protein NQ318_022700 [Aromia moschata]|uniref:Uncharacterized protein n=1 Tax=Aromia moschata TaxID=1265417 RepID=A0AAV8YDK6_9CUCU|nr:hypothetical protein NQ318_022700 [Aromia moschata]